MISFEDHWKDCAHSPRFWSCSQNEHKFLFDTARHHSPQTIIEIGTCMGWSALTLHRACPHAQIFSFDLFDKVQHNNNAPVGSDTRHILPDWVVFLTQTTVCDLRIPHDFAWIDAHHGSPQAFLDTLMCFRFAKFPYTMVWHDINLEKAGAGHEMNFGATQTWSAFEKIAHVFSLELSSCESTRAAHFAKPIDKYTFLTYLLKFWRLGKELEDIEVAYT